MPAKELQLIQRIRRAAGTRPREARSGIGDDCAVLDLPRGHEVLVTTDFTLENIHFRREWHPADSVGHRCLARGLSDIAAMGGIPRAAFLSLALPSRAAAALGRRFPGRVSEAGAEAIPSPSPAATPRSLPLEYSPTSSWLAPFLRARRSCAPELASATSSM